MDSFPKKIPALGKISDNYLIIRCAIHVSKNTINTVFVY